MTNKQFPSQTGILRWTGAHEVATKRDTIVVVHKETHEKEFPSGLFYYFNRNPENYFILLMMSEKNIMEEEDENKLR